MNAAQIRSFIIRHRVSIQDLAIILAGFAVAAYVAFEVDIFENEGHISRRQETLELDEILLLGGILAIGLLVFALRRYLEQKRETHRRITAEKKIRELAYEDALTGLANRRQFDEALKAAIASPPRAGASHALYMMDLNGFKRINDVYGHGTGDELLIVVAQRLRGAARQGDLVARFGGDEFAMLAEHLMGPEAATSIALRVIEALGNEIVLGGINHRVGAGIGITLIPHDAGTAEEAVRKADVALYRAKVERRSALRFFEQDMDRLVQEREHLERELRQAVTTGAIIVNFQPSVDLQTQAVVGFEAVPQWIHVELGEIPPERFLPIAEESGLVHELAEHLLRQACAVATSWPEHILLSMDVLPGQLTDRNLSSRIVGILGEYGIPPQRLEMEINESDLVRDLESAQTNFTALRETGVRIALDNFGTGYSSLYHLRNFKLDKIKIDRSYTESIGTRSENAVIVKALIGLGHGLGLTISAEGIADPGQRSELLGSGCEQGQGHLFSAPLPASATTGLFQTS